MAKSVYARFGTTKIEGLAPIERRHTTVGGETMALIAHKELGEIGYDSEIWRQVAEKNDIDDPWDLTAGEVLVIPSPAPSDT